MAKKGPIDPKNILSSTSTAAAEEGALVTQLLIGGAVASLAALTVTFSTIAYTGYKSAMEQRSEIISERAAERESEKAEKDIKRESFAAELKRQNEDLTMFRNGALADMSMGNNGNFGANGAQNNGIASGSNSETQKAEDIIGDSDFHTAEGIEESDEETSEAETSENPTDSAETGNEAENNVNNITNDNDDDRTDSSGNNTPASAPSSPSNNGGGSYRTNGSSSPQPVIAETQNPASQNSQSQNPMSGSPSQQSPASQDLPSQSFSSQDETIPPPPALSDPGTASSPYSADSSSDTSSSGDMQNGGDETSDFSNSNNSTEEGSALSGGSILEEGNGEIGPGIGMSSLQETELDEIADTGMQQHYSLSASVSKDENESSLKKTGTLTRSTDTGKDPFSNYYAATVYNDYNVLLDTSLGPMLYYNQHDSHWGSYKYGGSDPITSYGCGPTAAAMVVNAFGNIQGAITPKEMAEWSASYGYYAPQSGSYHNYIPAVLSAFDLIVDTVQDKSEENVRKLLKDGHIFIALMGRGALTKGGHFIVITRLNDDGTVNIADPNSYSNSTKKWDLSQILRELKDAYDSGGPLWSISRTMI